MICPHEFTPWVEVSPRMFWLGKTHRIWWRECPKCGAFDRKSMDTRLNPSECPTLTEDDVEALP